MRLVQKLYWRGETYLMHRLLSCLIALLPALAGAAQQPLPPTAQPSLPPLDGWTMTTQNTGYHYVTGTGNTSVQYDLLLPRKETPGNADWLAGVAKKDLLSSGYTLNPGKKTQEQTAQNFRSYSVFVRDNRGAPKALCYLASDAPGQPLYFARITMPDDPAAVPFLKAALNHFITYTRQGSTASGNGNPNPNPSPTTPGTAPTPPGNTTTTVTTPGEGLKPSQIKGIVLHSESGIGVGGMMIIIYRPYLLLNDGKLYAHPDVSPYDLNVARSQQAEPDKWGTWKLEGKTLTVQWGFRNGVPDRPSQWTGGYTWARAAKSGEKLSGSWGAISGGGNTAIGGGSIVVSSRNITFNNKGQFTQLSTGGGSYSDATGGVTAYSNKDAAGTYTLDGFSIEFKYNNGKTTRQCLYFYGDDQEVFGIGTRAYTPSGK